MYNTNHLQQYPRQEVWSRVGKWLSDDYSFKRGLAFGAILTAALVAFEIFNFSTTEFALSNLLGDARFIGIGWATILSIAFCGIDFAGLARLFTPERKHPPSIEIWYLVGAWFLGATMNAVMTWWAVSLTMLNGSAGNEVLTREQLLTYVPIFVAALVWITRILIIGTFSVAGERLFAQARDAALAVAREARNSTPLQPEKRFPRAPTVVRRPTASTKAAPARQDKLQEIKKAQYVGTGTRSRPEPHYEPLDAEGDFLASLTNGVQRTQN